MKYIVKAYASKLARPDYFPTDNSKETIAMLKDLGFIWIECREINIHDAWTEGVLKRCRVGGKAQRTNLQVLYNLQA